MYARVGLVPALALALWLAFPGTVGAAARIAGGACLFALILSPLSMPFEKRLGRGGAVFLAALLLIAAIGASAYLALPPIVREVGSVVDEVRKIASARLPAQAVDWALAGERLLMGGKTDAATLALGAVRAVGGIAGGAYRLSLMAVLGCFFAIDRENLLLRAELTIPLSVRKKCVEAARAARRELLLYARGQGLVALIVGALAAAALAIVGVRNALPLGIVVGACNAIPYFGPVLGGIPAVLAALPEGWYRAALTIAALAAVQQADGLVVSPRVMGGVTGFRPAAVMLIVFCGGTACGIPGMLLALPAAMVIRTLYRVFVQPPETD